MSGLSRVELASACVDHGLASYGTKTDLTHRLGTHLVEKKLGKATTHGAKRTSQDVKVAVPKRAKRPLTRWQSFMKSEMPNIKAAGFTGLVPTIKELGRRWRLVKKVNTPEGPLFLVDKQREVEQLAEAIRDLPEAEVNHALVVHGEVVSDSADDNAARLASALVVCI